MRVGSISRLGTLNDEEMVNVDGTLLPGGVSFTHGYGFAISKGTQYPELAYELVKQLVASQEIIAGLPGSHAAYIGLGSEPSESPVNPSFSPEAQALVDLALESSLPATALFYSEYVAQAMTSTGAKDDALTMLQAAEAQI